MKAFVLILLGIICFVGATQTPYMKHSIQKVSLIDKKEKKRNYKGHTRIRYILVLKDSKQRVFNLSVDESLYNRKKIGNVIAFNLREMDIKQTVKDNILFFFLPCIVASIFISLGLTQGFLQTISQGKYE